MHGVPMGVLREMAISLVSQQAPPVTSAQRLTAMRNGIHALHRLGVTAIHDQRYGGGMEGGEALRVPFSHCTGLGNLQLRVPTAISLPQISIISRRWALRAGWAMTACVWAMSNYLPMDRLAVARRGCLPP